MPTWHVLMVTNLALVAVASLIEWLVSHEPESGRAGRRLLITLCLYPILRVLIPLLVPGACP